LIVPIAVIFTLMAVLAAVPAARWTVALQPHDLLRDQ
jgi:hypothetical protein